MPLVAILSILSGQGSLMGIEHFPKRYRKTLNEILGTDFGKSPSDSTFRLLLAQLDVPGLECLLLNRSGSPHGSFTTRWVGVWPWTISQCPEPVGRSTGPRWI